jgi:2-polyprenyl-3-methyl-5-hydroxy-6-metoxy-1,4-benzoquinol methylase
MSYLLNQKTLHPVNETLGLMFSHINQYKSLNKMRVLEIGIGSGNTSIPISKLFKSYYGIEKEPNIYEVFIELCEKNNCNIKSYNMNFEQFTNNNKNTRKFDLIILINTIHFIGYDDLIRLSKRIVKKNAFIVIQHPHAKPDNWRKPQFNKDSSEFDEIRWLKMKNILEKTYNDISNSKYLDKIEKNDRYRSDYFILKTNNYFT